MDGTQTPRTRRQLLRGAAAGAAATALTAGGLPEALYGSGTPTALAASAASISEIDRLQRLIRVELLLQYCYRYILSGSILTARARRTIAPFYGHVEAHVAALRHQLAARGGLVPAGPTSVTQANHFLGHRRVGGRLGQLRGDKDALRLLLSTEQVVIGAYFVALLKLEAPALLELCAQIMATGAQHDAILRLLLSKHDRFAAAAPYGLVQGLQ
ncbi:MAG: ferritin-like domain-containing protein [Solirubrobacteraceae bacterium]